MYNRVTSFGCFLVLRKLLLVSFCVVVWVLFSVFSIFCITSLVSATPRNHPSFWGLNSKSAWNQSLSLSPLLSFFVNIVFVVIIIVIFIIVAVIVIIIILLSPSLSPYRCHYLYSDCLHRYHFRHYGCNPVETCVVERLKIRTLDRPGFKPRPKRCFFRQGTLLLFCLSLPWCINKYR